MLCEWGSKRSGCPAQYLYVIYYPIILRMQDESVGCAEVDLIRSRPAGGVGRNRLDGGRCAGVDTTVVDRARPGVAA